MRDLPQGVPTFPTYCVRTTEFTQPTDWRNVLLHLRAVNALKRCLLSIVICCHRAPDADIENVNKNYNQATSLTKTATSQT